MKTFDEHHRHCLKQQTVLREVMEQPGNHAAAVELFLKQHGMLHSAAVSQGQEWSYEDAVLDDLPEPLYRQTARKFPHSIAWLAWHIARCEDITMNILVAGSPQVLWAGGWHEKMQAEARDTGNEMSAAELEAFNQAINIPALRGYRQAVGLRTRAIVLGLAAGDLDQKVGAERVPQVYAEGAVVPQASYLTDYWSKRTVAGLLLMPATRHNLTHLMEARDLKKALLRQEKAG